MQRLVKKGDKYHRYLYAFEFEDNSVYVGLSFNVEKRHRDHKVATPQIVTKIKNNTNYKFIAYSELYHIDIAGQKESELVEKYKQQGWVILNRAKPGSLGGKLCLWILEKCKTDAAKYKLVEDWYKFSRKAYLAAKYHGWFEECTKDLARKQMPRNYWTYERCLAIALKYKTRKEWEEKNIASYSFARRSGCLEECTKHMGKKLTRLGYWNLTNCKNEALKYKYRSEWSSKNQTAYKIAHKNNWIDICCAHMERKSRVNHN